MRISRLSALLLCSLFPTAGCVGSVDGENPLPGEEDPDEPWAGADAGSCPNVEVELRDVTPTVQVLVDRSGTMTAGFSGTDRWNAVYQTLMNQNTGIVKQLEGQVRFGATLYTGQDNNPVCPILSTVTPAMNNYASIEDMYSDLGPVEDTPTAESIAAVVQTLDAINEDGPRIIVLATDGLPDSCDDPDPDGQPEALAGAIEAAQAAYAAGIELYIISVGDDVAQSHLQDMANAGVGLPVDGMDNAPYYQALNSAALVAAFDDIISGVRSCSFSMDGQVSDPERGTVTLDGAELDYGTEWQLSDSTTLQLLGAACDEIMDGGDHEVQASFECGSVVD